MILADCPELKKIQWRCVVIDEAHRLKNRNCKLLEGLKLMSLVRLSKLNFFFCVLWESNPGTRILNGVQVRTYVYCCTVARILLHSCTTHVLRFAKIIVLCRYMALKGNF